jgi:hypothetical protein
VGAVVNLRSCYSQVILFGRGGEKCFIYGAAIHKNITWCRRSCSFTEMLFSGHICCGNTGSFTELLFLGKIFSFRTVLHLRNCYSQETLFSLGAVVHLRNCYSQEILFGAGTVVLIRSLYSQEHNLLWEQ